MSGPGGPVPEPADLPVSAPASALLEPPAPPARPPMARTVARVVGAAAAANLRSALAVVLVARLGGLDDLGWAGTGTVLGALVGLATGGGVALPITSGVAAGTLAPADVVALVRWRTRAALAALLLVLPVVVLLLPGGRAGVLVACFVVSTTVDLVADTAWSVRRGTGRGGLEVRTGTVAVVVAAGATAGLLGWSRGDVLLAGALAVVLSAGVALVARWGATLEDHAADAEATATVDPAIHASRRGRARPSLAHLVTRHGRRCAPYLAGDLLGLAYLRGAVLVVGAVAGAGAVGTYVAATSLTNPAVQLGAAAGVGAAAALAGAAPAERPGLLLRTTWAFLAAGAAGGAGLLLLGPAVADVVLGPGVATAAGPVLPWLALFLVLRAPDFALSAALVAEGRGGTRLGVLGRTVAVGTVATLGLAAGHGAVGAAAGAVVAEAVALGAFVRRLARPELRAPAAAAGGAVVVGLAVLLGLPAVVGQVLDQPVDGDLAAALGRLALACALTALALLAHRRAVHPAAGPSAPVALRDEAPSELVGSAG